MEIVVFVVVDMWVVKFGLVGYEVGVDFFKGCSGVGKVYENNIVLDVVGYFD